MWHWPGMNRWRGWLRGCLVLLLLGGSPAGAGGEDPYPEFVADYDVRVNGIKVGSATFRLSHLERDEYLYRSEASKAGLGRLLGSDKATESSRWRLADGRVQVLEYQAHNADGDDDDNAHLLFDWDSLEVENRGAGEHWRIAMPAGTLDQMVMQLAMLFDLRDGKTEFRYPVATRGRIKEYVEEYTNAKYFEGTGVWTVPVDVALPCATQNELNGDDATTLLRNGCICVAEGANMPSTPEAIEKIQEAGILYGPGKAANAGGVAVSGLEMSQNSLRLSWTREEVDQRLHGIMCSIHDACTSTADEYGQPGNYVLGANIAGFIKVADSMLDQGVV